MMSYERSENTQDNFGKFIYQFQPETKTLIRKLKRILIKLYRPNVSLLFNQTCLNERLQPYYTHTHTHTHALIYMYIYSTGNTGGSYLFILSLKNYSLKFIHFKAIKILLEQIICP